MAAPKGYQPAPKLKYIKGSSTKKSEIEADRALYKYAGYKPRVVKEGNTYKIYVKK